MTTSPAGVSPSGWSVTSRPKSASEVSDLISASLRSPVFTTWPSLEYLPSGEMAHSTYSWPAGAFFNWWKRATISVGPSLRGVIVKFTREPAGQARLDDGGRAALERRDVEHRRGVGRGRAGGRRGRDLLARGARQRHDGHARRHDAAESVGRVGRVGRQVGVRA